MLTREQILNAADIVTEDVAVPEWGGTVRVTTLSAAERNAWESSLRTADGITADNASAGLAVRCMVDLEGQRVFEDADVEALGRKSAAALSRVITVALRLNGLGRGEVESAVKN